MSARMRRPQPAADRPNGSLKYQLAHSEACESAARSISILSEEPLVEYLIIPGVTIVFPQMFEASAS